MSRRPKPLSKRPTQLALEDPRGDVLSDVLGVALLRHALYRRIEARAPWGILVPNKPRALFYVIARGTAWLELPGRAPIVLSAGDVAFIAHGTAHVLRDAPRTIPHAVCDAPAHAHRPTSATRMIGGTGAATTIIAGFFELDGNTPILLGRMPEVVVLAPNEDAQLQATVQLILTESMTPGLASTLVLHRLADVLFVHALRLISRDTRCPRGLPALVDPAVHGALSLIHGDFAKAWTVAGLAKAVGMSRSAFAARFTELVGEPPLQYLARWRIARAAELLRDTEDGIDRIAARVGYASAPSFSKAFKSAREISPGAFRASSRAG